MTVTATNFFGSGTWIAARNLLIDLQGLESVDPFGLALLLKASRTSGVRVTNPSPATREACRRTDTDLLAA